MKVIKPSHKHIEHDCMPLEFIERIGRTCYKSTDKITDGSAVKFVQNLVARGHWAMIEHETAYFVLYGLKSYQRLLDELHIIEVGTKFIRISEIDGEVYIVSGNLRAFYDAFVALQSMDEKFTQSVLLKFYEHLAKEFPDIYSSIVISNIEPDYDADVDITNRDELPINYKAYPEVISKHLTHSVLFTCDRGVSHELVRHRPVSFAQESTRYCNYSQDKFDGGVTFIRPFFYDEDSLEYRIWEHAMDVSETAYLNLLEQGSTPQEARSVLPNSLKTEIIMTATEEEWQHIVNLRAKGTTGKPHPQMVEIMEPWYEELKIITDGRIS